MDALPLLRSIALFEGLGDDDLRELGQSLQRRAFAAGAMVFDQGDAGSSMYIVEDGEVNIHLPGDASRRISLKDIACGEYFGELALFDLVAGAIEVGVPYLSVYAFSTENWKRSPEEVRFLMGYNREVLRRRRDQLHEWGVRVRWAGRRPRLWSSVVSELAIAEEQTRENTVMTKAAKKRRTK